jgi:hypothetical protein
LMAGGDSSDDLFVSDRHSSLTEAVEKMEFYPFNPAGRLGPSYDLAAAMERAAGAVLRQTKTPKDFIKLAVFKAFPTADMKEMKWNVLIDTVPYFVALKPSFLELANLMIALPLADAARMKKVAEAIESDPVSGKLASHLKFAIFLSKLSNLSLPERTGGEIDPLIEARSRVFGRHLLLNLFREPQAIERGEEMLIHGVLGADLFGRLKIRFQNKEARSPGVVRYVDFWGNPYLPTLLILARKCAQSVGLVARRPSPSFK